MARRERLARRHHFVPQFYLKRFADARGRITAHDLASHEEYETTPKSAANELDYYIVATRNGPSDAIEKELSKLEGATAAALREIDSGRFPPSDSVRGAISNFMALQSVRGPEFRDLGDRLATDIAQLEAMVIAARPDVARAELREILQRDPSDEELARFLASLKADFRVRVSREQHVDTMLRVAESTLPMFYRRKWFLATASELVTSDQPVALWGRHTGTAPDDAVGLLNADEIAMAISPERALVLRLPDELIGQNQGPERVVQLTRRAAIDLQKRLWNAATRHTFRRPGTPRPADGIKL